MKKIIIFGLMIQWFNGLIPIAHAQSTTLSVSPPVVEILLAPTKKVTQTFTLQATGEDVIITPELHLVKPSDDSGHMQIDPAPLNPSSIPLTYSINQAGPTYTLTLESASTDVPQDVYLALVFRASPRSSTIYDLPSTLTTPSIAALMLVTINPTGVIPINLEIQNFDLPFFHDSWLPLTARPSLKNSTPIMIRPHGKYEIISPTGETIFSLPLYPNLILGNSSRSLRSTIHDLPSTLTWSPSWSAIGPYALRLTVTTEGGTSITSVEKTIWLLPLRLIIISSALIICLLTLIYKISKFKIV
jgi:hypothetical protein